MARIPLPASVRIIKRIEWTLDRPAQINRSPYTGVRTVVADPWHGLWRARAELAPIIGEAKVLAWRAFLAKLKGQINTFRLPATEGAQNGNGGVTVSVTRPAGATTMSIVGWTTSLLAGQFVTVDGQLLQLTEEQSGNLITFEPPLRKQALLGTTVVTSRPYALVSLANSAVGWNVDPCQLYGITLDVEEAILEDDGTPPESAAPPVQFNIFGPTTDLLAEGNSIGAHFQFFVSRSGEDSIAASINWAVTGSGGDPASSGDFTTPVSGALTFLPGETVKPLNVRVKPDAAVEADEQFTVTISSPSLGTVGTATATATIIDDDDASGAARDDIIMEDGSAILGEDGSNIIVE